MVRNNFRQLTLKTRFGQAEHSSLSLRFQHTWSIRYSHQQTRMSLLIIFGVIILLPITALFGLWFWYQWKNQRMLQFARNLPVVNSTLPIIGHLHHAFPDIDGIISNVVLNMSRKAVTSNVGGMCLWAGPLPFILIQNPEDIQLLLNSASSLERGSDYRLIKFALGDGLFTSPVRLWTLQRRHLLPMFMSRSFEHMIPQMNEKAREIANELSENVGKREVDVFDVIMGPLVSLTGYFLFGPISDVDFYSKSTMVRDICKAVIRSFEILAIRVVRIWLQWEELFQLLYRKDLATIKSLTVYSQIALKVFREQFNNETQDQEFKIGAITSQVFFPEAFSNLFRSNPSIVKEENFENLINNMFGAGAYTNATILSSCFLALAQQPKLQEKLFNEIISVLGDSTDSEVTTAEINRLPYLDRVLKETMRLFTLAPFISRTVTEDIKTSLGTIPSGTSLYLDIYGNHMNPHVFPNPDKFDPDRFLPENTTKRSKLSYMPFSGGPRNCIGKDYAMVVMKLVVVHVLRRFKLHTDAKVTETKFLYRSTLFRQGGYPIRAEKRG